MTPEIRKRLTEIISAGLVTGTGSTRPGELCIESAICLAMGEPHSDWPSCVASPDGAFALTLNDSPWSSPAARAGALLPLALAQLGTAGDDRTEWVRRVAEGTIRRVLPMALRAAAAGVGRPHCDALEAAAVRCEQEGSAKAARAAWLVTNRVSVASVRARIIDGPAIIGDWGTDVIYAAAHAAARAYASIVRATASTVRAIDVLRERDATLAALAAGEVALACADLRGIGLDGDAALRTSIEVALQAYAAEGRS